MSGTHFSWPSARPLPPVDSGLFISFSLTCHRQPTGGCGQSFTSLIVSPQFAGLNSLKRHRAVNAALKQEIAAIHAWSAKCQTPEEWERDKAKNSNPAGPPMEGTVGGKVEGVNA